jgi:hypothetical protein
MTTPDFARTRLELARARAAAHDAEMAVMHAEAQRKAAAARLDRHARGLDTNDPAAVSEGERLEAAAKKADDDATAAREQARRARDAVATAVGGFAGFADPRENAGRLSDRSPVALLPVRLETRFVDKSRGKGERQQLWVRIYPDDCWVDTFEPMLSATELANAQRYWRGIWRAGGVEADERAAWGGLVSAHGSGRAGWIVDTYQPANLGEQPTKADVEDAILVIPTQTPLTAPEEAALAAYWQAIWLAGNDAAKQQAARDTLDTAVGPAHADELVAAYQPYNLADTPQPPTNKNDVGVSTAFLIFPPDPPTKQASWSQAPRVRQFPERFVVLAYSGGEQVLEAIGGLVDLPLYVGPDPSADPSEAIHPEGGDLFVPDELKWLSDFDRAVETGMGLAIDLTPEQARNGFDRILVLGLHVGANDSESKTALEGLLRQHATGRSGLTLVPQGTPTHNTTGTETGYTRLDDADQSFDDRRDAPLFTVTNDPLQKRDGQWLAESLGVDPALFQTVHGSGGADQLQARAMQRALWPATIGYWMDKMLVPIFNDTTVETTRWFLTQYVSGRGAVPAIRIGGQPYGVLPTTAFSRIRWLDDRPRDVAREDPHRCFLARLLSLLQAIDADWTAMSDEAASVEKPGDAHQTLLDIVGLHPASIEFRSRYAESLTELYNILNLSGYGLAFWQAWLALDLQAAAAALLARLGYTGSERPDILEHVFMSEAGQIGNVIDDQPLSETTPIRAYTDDGRNYIRWLIDAASASLDAVNAEQGFSDDTTPRALLYLFLRHALMLGYFDAGYRLHKNAGFLTEQELVAMKPEPAFIHVAEAATASESRFATLYKLEPRITASPSLPISDYITANLATLPEAIDLADQVDALHQLADAPTAQLERAFAEHIDICSYRFDAWLLGLVNYQLQAMRAPPDGNGSGSAARTGIYLGAYAWIENLRPSTTRPTPIRLPPDLEQIFGDGPIVHDPRNGGYIHAPSLMHARTAAVLRSGYLANATPANPETMAVNLSSDRVRLALSVLEGIRNAQNLGALLGYRFERGLHDDHDLVEVDKFIYPLRKAFPLVADALQPTKTPPNVPIEAIEARNVLDGRKLIAHIRRTGNAAYPFGLTTLPPASAAEAAAIDAEADSMRDVYDAVADLALAEGVHQAAQGNFERVAATLDAYTSGNFPPDPEVVQTPAPGIGLTHRLAVQLRPGLTAAASATHRARAEPAVDAWLAEVLPGLDDIGCTVIWTDPTTGTEQQTPVTLADLEVRPIDVLALVKPDHVQAMTELDDRVLRFVITTVDPRPDVDLQIRYMTAPSGKLSLFEVTPLVRSLKTLVSRSRPLRATDAMLQSDASPEHDTTVFLERARIATPKGDLDTLSADVGAFLATLAPLAADPVANRAAIVAAIDGLIADAVALLERAASFNLPLSGWGFAYAWRHDAFADLLAQVDQLVTRWNDKLAEFDSRLAAYDALPPGTSDDDRLIALQAAELLVSTSLDPLPATPAEQRASLNNKRAAFAARRDEFAAVHASPDPSFANLVTAIEALLPVGAFDSQPFDISSSYDRAVLVLEDLTAKLSAQRAAIDVRRVATQAQVDAHDAAASAAARVQALQDGAQALLGEEFRIVPEFTLSTAQGDEWANAVGSSDSLLDYLTNTAKLDFPVDEWLHGAARTRPMVRAWETTVLLAGAFGRPEPRLTPIQLPHDPAAPWLAMQFPSDYTLDSDRLLYTAQYSTPFDKSARQCGLLIDEWTETIPGTKRTTGITFNFDRPDNEPPQTILLVTPATANGSWQWDDLVGALNETLDLAKKRAVEPDEIYDTPYAPLLPATIMAASLYGISITTALAAANDALRLMEVPIG